MVTNLTEGKVNSVLWKFTLPMFISVVFQQFYNMADSAIAGKFAGEEALAAVGSTTALINVFTNLFIGISLGANVLAARFYAAGKDEEMSETVHTSILLALISGIIMASSRNPEYSDQFFQCAAPVLCKFFWLHCNGRIYGSKQYLRISVCVCKFSYPGLHELYQSELWCAKTETYGPGAC